MRAAVQRSVYATQNPIAQPQWIAAVDERSTWQRVIDANKYGSLGAQTLHQAYQCCYSRQVAVVARGVGCGCLCSLR